MPAPIKAVLYARYSPRPKTKPGEHECQSIEHQLAACITHCKEKGYEIVEVCTDEGRSGADEDRPGLFQALKALKKGYRLIAWRADRLARGVYLDEWIRRQVKIRKAVLEVTEGELDDGSPERTLIRQVLTAFSEYERKLMNSRTRHAMRVYQSQGRRMSLHPPYGWSDDPTDSKRLVPNHKERDVIKRIVTLWKEDNSLRNIGTILTREGVAPRTKNVWHHQSIGKILVREGFAMRTPTEARAATIACETRLTALT